MRWTTWPSRHDDVTVNIYDGAILIATRSVDQTMGAGQWNSLGTFTFTSGAEVRIVSDTEDFSTNANAARLVPQ